MADFDLLIGEGVTCQASVVAEPLRAGPAGTVQSGSAEDILVVRITAPDWVVGTGIGGELNADFTSGTITLPNSSLLPALTGNQRMRITLFDDPCCPTKREVIEVGPPTSTGMYPVLCRALEGTTKIDTWRVGDHYCADVTVGQMQALFASMAGQSRDPAFAINNNFVTTNVTGAAGTMPNASEFTNAGITN